MMRGSPHARPPRTRRATTSPPSIRHLTSGIQFHLSASAGAPANVASVGTGSVRLPGFSELVALAQSPVRPSGRGTTASAQVGGEARRVQSFFARQDSAHRVGFGTGFEDNEEVDALTGSRNPLGPSGQPATPIPHPSPVSLRRPSSSTSLHNESSPRARQPSPCTPSRTTVPSLAYVHGTTAAAPDIESRRDVYDDIPERGSGRLVSADVFYTPSYALDRLGALPVPESVTRIQEEALDNSLDIGSARQESGGEEDDASVESGADIGGVPDTSILDGLDGVEQSWMDYGGAYEQEPPTSYQPPVVEHGSPDGSSYSPNEGRLSSGDSDHTYGVPHRREHPRSRRVAPRASNPIPYTQPASHHSGIEGTRPRRRVRREQSPTPDWTPPPRSPTPEPEQSMPDLAAYRAARVKQSRHRKLRGSHCARKHPWSEAETHELTKLIVTYGPFQWQLLLDKDAEGLNVLRYRTNTDVKDKARNIARMMILSGEEVHPAFRRIIGKHTREGKQLYALMHS